MEGIWLRLAVVLIASTLAGAASALPVVSVDSNPGLAGVQADSDVLEGLPFVVDIVISGVDGSAPLNAFEFDLDFDPLFISAVSVADGGFLLDPVFVIQMNLGTVSVEFAEATLGAGGAVGAGVLATITFDADALGTSFLDLNDVILAAPFGVPIPTGAINDGTVTVVPEASTGALLSVGLVALVARRRPASRQIHRR